MGKLHFDSGVGLATQSRGIVGLNDSLSEAVQRCTRRISRHMDGLTTGGIHGTNIRIGLRRDGCRVLVAADGVYVGKDVLTRVPCSLNLASEHSFFNPFPL